MGRKRVLLTAWDLIQWRYNALDHSIVYQAWGIYFTKNSCLRPMHRNMSPLCQVHSIVFFSFVRLFWHDGFASSHLFIGVTEAREDWFRWCFDNWGSGNWLFSIFASGVSEAGETVGRGGWDNHGFVSTKEVSLKSGSLLNIERGA